MAIDYEKYLVKKALWEAGWDVRNRQSPMMTLMSNRQVPGVDCHVLFGWIYGVPDPNPSIHEHVHDFDQIVLHVGGDPENHEDLGGEILFYVGGQPLTITTTSGLFIPRGVPHGPIIWNRVTRPHVQMAILLGCGDVEQGWGKSGVNAAKDGLPQKRDNRNYEKYLVRKPVYEQGAAAPVKNRQHPTMTLMSSAQVPECSQYIELGWIYGKPDPDPHIFEMVHEKYDEIGFHWGCDPQNPHELGAVIEGYHGGQKLVVDKSSAIWTPRGLRHGPIEWKKFVRPHIQMAFMPNCGDLKEGWADSGIYEKK